MVIFVAGAASVVFHLLIGFAMKWCIDRIDMFHDTQIFTKPVNDTMSFLYYGYPHDAWNSNIKKTCEEMIIPVSVIWEGRLLQDTLEMVL